MTLPRLGLFASALLAALFASASSADDWPRFRGPNGTGVSADKNVPLQWTAQSGLLWKVPLPGTGNSSPIISKGKVFLEAASADARDRMLLCLDVKDGSTLWSAKARGGPGKTHAKSSLASSTPAADGEHVFALFWNGSDAALYAYDYAGKELWSQPLGAFKSQHGYGTSPVVYDGRVFVANDQDEKADLYAFEAATGKPVWKKSRPPHRACYSAPFLLEAPAGGRLIVASTGGITAYDPKTGDEAWNYTWSFAGMPLRTVGSPIYHQGMIFACSGDGNGARHAIAIKATGKGEVPATNLVWEKTRETPYVPTLLGKGDHVYGVTDTGFAFCVVANTGQELWRQRIGSGGVTASPVLIDGKIYAINEAGDCFVLAAEPKFQVLAKSAVGETVYASPAVADGKLFIRGQSHLFCVGK